MKATKWFTCACGKLIPEFSGILEVHKKFCGKMRAKEKAGKRLREDDRKTPTGATNVRRLNLKDLYE